MTCQTRALNESATVELLTVMSNFLLKSDLEAKALEAGEHDPAAVSY